MLISPCALVERAGLRPLFVCVVHESNARERGSGENERERNSAQVSDLSRERAAKRHDFSETGEQAFAQTAH